REREGDRSHLGQGLHEDLPPSEQRGNHAFSDYPEVTPEHTPVGEFSARPLRAQAQPAWAWPRGCTATVPSSQSTSTRLHCRPAPRCISSAASSNEQVLR